MNLNAITLRRSCHLALLMVLFGTSLLAACSPAGTPAAVVKAPTSLPAKVKASPVLPTQPPAKPVTEPPAPAANPTMKPAEAAAATIIAEKATTAADEALAASTAAAPTATELVLAKPTATPSPTAIVAPSGPTAVVESDAIFLRSGPSTLFTIDGRYPKGTAVGLTGRARGDGWLKVRTPEGNSGWMYTAYLTYTLPLASLPVVDLPYSYIVSGTVTTDDGRPLPGITLAVAGLNNPSSRNDVTTGANGVYYAYLPGTAAGYWKVDIVGLTCGIRVLNDACDLAGYIARYDHAQLVMGKPPLRADFVYDKVDMVLTGNVIGQPGQILQGLRVRARRKDGATSWGTVKTGGGFAMPIAPGIWDVYLINERLKESKHMVWTVMPGTTPQPVTLRSP